jgi:L-amino acid N-acyltransferase YncA
MGSETDEANGARNLTVMNMPIAIRKAILMDLVAITEIYNEAVLNTVATFDTKPKTIEERKAWFTSHDAKHPILVAEQGGTIVGWASLSKWSERRGYAGTAEASLYVEKSHRGSGIGKALLKAIIQAGQEVGLHAVIAQIAEGNEPSIHLAEELGFNSVGVLREVGCKFGKRLDVNVMQRIIGSN